MKTCFKCQTAKPLEAFYAHAKMADGRLNKCKDCTKADVSNRIQKKQLDPEWVADERARCRQKQAKYRQMGRAAKTTAAARKKWGKINPQKRRAQLIAGHAKRSGKLVAPLFCEVCGSESSLQMHHPDYSQPLFVKWLCTKCHGEAHWKT